MADDIHYAARSLFKAPTFTIVAVLTLALGIGANTAIFSLLDATLLKPLPYRDPGRLVALWGRFTDIGLPNDRNQISPPEFRDIEAAQRSFSAIAAVDGNSYGVNAGSRPERVGGASVSPSFFDLFGVQPAIGRAFRDEESQVGRDNVALLSHGFWERSFGSDPHIVGRVVRVNGTPTEIVGVMPSWFGYPTGAEMWKPLAFTPDQLTPNYRGSHSLEAIARLKPGLTVAQARDDMKAVTNKIVSAHPEYPYARFNYAVEFATLLEDSVGDIRSALFLLMGAVGCVLLIACANVANLQLVRSSARAREFAVRAALGAGHRRIAMQLLTESGLLATAGGGLGLIAGFLMMRAIVPAAAKAFPHITNVNLDVSVLAFTTILSLGTVLVFGVAPALQGTRIKLGDALKASTRTTAASPASRRMRRVLVAGEIAVSLVLLAGAGLFGRSLIRLLDVDPGFRPDGVLTFRVSLPSEKYQRPEDIRNFYRTLLTRVRGVPGVTSAGAVSALPLSGDGGSGTTTIDTTAVPLERRSPESDWRPVLPGYFETMGVRLVSGRFFTEQDSEQATPVAIVDETMARLYWPGQDAVGKRLHLGGSQSNAPWMTIVGVVGHVRYRTLEAQSRTEFYWPELQQPRAWMGFVVRSPLDAGTLKAVVERQIQAIDPDQPVYAVRTMNELLADSIARRRLATVLLAIFAGIALLLAIVGVYGLTAYAVAERTQELGIRMALGEDPRRVVAWVVGQSVLLAIVGVIIGLIGTAALARLVSSQLYDTKPGDPLTFGLVSAALLAAGAAAAYAPARRAALIDPAITLRAE